MKWCMECGEVGKPEPAVTEVDGDPLCAGHAKARGIETYGKVAVVESPSAPKEKQMATCACGCGGQLKPDSVWNYLRGHKTAHKQGQDVPVPKKAKPAPEKQTSIAPADPDFLDSLWNALPDDHKRDALRAVFDAIL